LKFTSFRDLRVKAENDLRDRTKRFALEVIRMFTVLSKTAEASVLGMQALRSGTSLGIRGHRYHAALCAVKQVASHKAAS